MKNFFRDVRGAVTVMVTLLLIPAVLVSGTAVDLARIYSARSILHDANQLAANSVLASYDALLQDLYGLYGVMAQDEQLAAMVDEYIQTAVLGEDWKETGLGTFQLFYGSDPETGGVAAAEGQNLANPEVLRRQIEEYAKFRAPVILVEELLEGLESFQKVSGDAAVIKQKMDIDDKVEEIDQVYRKLYQCILEVNAAQEAESAAVEAVNGYLLDIREELQRLSDTRDDYTQARREGREEDAAGYEAKYQAVLENLRALAGGGTLGTGWLSDGAGSGGWSQETQVPGLQETIRIHAEELDDYIDNSNWEDDDLEDLLQLCRQADNKRRELNRMLDDLEADLNREGYCSDQLRDGLTEPAQESGRSVLDEYRELLSYDSLEGMAQAVRDRNAPQLRQTIALLEGAAYGTQSTSIGLEELAALREGQVPIDLLLDDRAGEEDLLGTLAGLTPRQYQVPGEGFQLFQASCFSSTENGTFFTMLEQVYGGGGENEEKKEKVKDSVTDLLGVTQDAFRGLTFQPEGAWTYRGASLVGGGAASGVDFGTDGDWGEEDEAKDQTKAALESSLINRLGALADQGVNKLLLLTYASEMFSDFTTPSGEETAVNMAGVPLSVDVNYYFQSELEYLYAGDLRDAQGNLKTVAGMIFLVRFVFDYIASFSIDEVNAAVSAIKGALSFAGPFAVVVGELARVAIAMAEATIDVNRLRTGAEVAVYKNNDTWQFSLSGLVDAATGEVGSISVSQLTGTEDRQDDEGFTLSYKDYLRLFLLLVEDNVLCTRTANLIALNVTNKREGIGDIASRTGREDAMASAELFDLSRLITGFSITTTAELKMLFLSMPFAQRGAGGVVPPGSVAVSARDDRGY